MEEERKIKEGPLTRLPGGGNRLPLLHPSVSVNESKII